MNKTDSERLNASTGWTPRQRNHLRRLVKAGATIAYVVTDRHGRPANGGPATREWQVRAGLIQTLPGPLRQTCGQGALHGTLEPHRWNGERCWLAGWVGGVVRGDYKLWGLHREIIGEVYPETALSDSVGARIGRRNLSGANLSGAYLSGANLSGANLCGANLCGANLCGANRSNAKTATALVDAGRENAGDTGVLRRKGAS